MTSQVKCPLCDRVAEFVGRAGGRDAYVCKCDVCGRFIFTDEFVMAVEAEPNRGNRYLISSLTRRASDRAEILELLSYSVEELIALAPKPRTPSDVLDPLMIAIHASMVDVSSPVRVALNDYPLFALRSSDQLGEFLGLLQQLELVTARMDEAKAEYVVWLTLKGWERIAELRRTGRSSAQAFVAMSFAPELDAAWSNGIQPALVSAGWRPLRMDRLQHNERIDDKIISEIRRSGLLVADFTGQRAGVYFEAGFAQGLGIPVIWTVTESELASVHFDTRQYNHIVWSNPEELRERLYDRVMASIAPPRKDAA